MPPPDCLICGGKCVPVLTGLWDDRYGAPGIYDVVKCNSCGLEQTHPQPSEMELKELYEQFYGWGGDQDSAYARLRERFMASGLYHLWLQWDGDISFHLRRGSGRLLDFGCNEGRSLTLYAQNGFHVQGFEINERAAAVARERGFPVFTVPLAEFVPENPYDVVVLSNVLEHASDPVAMLRQIRRLLQPEGELWISCPNAFSFWRRVFGAHWINWHVPFHLWHFSPQTLKYFLDKCSYRPIEMQTCTPVLWLALSLCAGLGSKAERVNNFLRLAPLVAGLMLATKGVFQPFLKNKHARMAGDCLLVRAKIV
jgi:SAM-dependent methyltransferase